MYTNRFDLKRFTIIKQENLRRMVTGFRANDTTDILISQLFEKELYATETVACHTNRCVLYRWAGSENLKLQIHM
jgi:hypothetical protein